MGGAVIVMSTGETLALCPWCGTSVSPQNMATHQSKRCPQAPSEVKATRPPKLLKPKKTKGRGCRNIHRPADPDVHTTPTIQDRHINPSATTFRAETGVFYVSNVLRSGGAWTYSLSAECSYCHRTIEIRANGPSGMAQYARDEACRLALIDHLRTEHGSRKS